MVIALILELLSVISLVLSIVLPILHIDFPRPSLLIISGVLNIIAAIICIRSKKKKSKDNKDVGKD